MTLEDTVKCIRLTTVSNDFEQVFDNNIIL